MIKVTHGRATYDHPFGEYHLVTHEGEFIRSENIDDLPLNADEKEMLEQYKQEIISNDSD